MQRLLAPGYMPSVKDVVCGRGRHIEFHPGNRRLKLIVANNVDKYKDAKTKPEKSDVIYNIVELIRRDSPNGGFVDRDPNTGRWYEIGDALAREKVGQSLRFTIRSQSGVTRARSSVAKARTNKSGMAIKETLSSNATKKQEEEEEVSHNNNNNNNESEKETNNPELSIISDEEKDVEHSDKLTSVMEAASALADLGRPFTATKGVNSSSPVAAAADEHADDDVSPDDTASSSSKVIRPLPAPQDNKTKKKKTVVKKKPLKKRREQIFNNALANNGNTIIRGTGGHNSPVMSLKREHQQRTLGLNIRSRKDALMLVRAEAAKDNEEKAMRANACLQSSFPLAKNIPSLVDEHNVLPNFTTGIVERNKMMQQYLATRGMPTRPTMMATNNYNRQTNNESLLSESHNNTTMNGGANGDGDQQQQRPVIIRRTPPRNNQSAETTKQQQMQQLSAGVLNNKGGILPPPMRHHHHQLPPFLAQQQQRLLNDVGCGSSSNGSMRSKNHETASCMVKSLNSDIIGSALNDLNCDKERFATMMPRLRAMNSSLLQQQHQQQHQQQAPTSSSSSSNMMNHYQQLIAMNRNRCRGGALNQTDMMPNNNNNNNNALIRRMPSLPSAVPHSSPVELQVHHHHHIHYKE